MTDTATETRSLRFERLLDAPIATVWEWLADSEKRGHWFAAGPMEPREGGAVELIFDHDNLSDEDVPYPPAYAPYKGVVAKETVLRFDPPHLLTISFESGIAEFALFPEGERTRLVLTHKGVSEAARAGTGAGWHSHFAVLEARLAGRGVPDFWALHAQSEAAFARGEM